MWIWKAPPWRAGITRPLLPPCDASVQFFFLCMMASTHPSLSSSSCPTHRPQPAGHPRLRLCPYCLAAPPYHPLPSVPPPHPPPNLLYVSSEKSPSPNHNLDCAASPLQPTLIHHYAPPPAPPRLRHHPLTVVRRADVALPRIFVG
jgi:hypothetical protein